MAGIGQAGFVSGLPSAFKHTAFNRRIDDPEAVLFGENRVLIRDSSLDVVNAFDVRHIRAQPEIRQPAVLADGLQLKIRV